MRSRSSALFMAASVAAGLLVAGGGAPAASTGSGLYGVVKRGPTRPVCEVGTPCDAPAPNVTLLFLRSGRVVSRAVTNRLGRYRIGLRPAVYSIRTTQKAFGRIPDPSRVAVTRGRYARVDFHIDTGIR